MKKILLVIGLLLLSACTPAAETIDRISLLDGTATTLDSHIAGKPAIINFWAAWCPFCKQELPLLEQAFRDNPDIAVVGVNLQESTKTVRRYWKNGGYSFPTLFDPHTELSKKFGVFTQPTTIFLNADSEIIFQKNGPLDATELATHIRDLQDNVQIQATKTTPSCGSGGQICNARKP